MTRRTIIVADDEYDDTEPEPYLLAEQIVDLLEDLRRRREVADGTEVADAFRRSITGVCSNGDGVSCVEIDGKQYSDHWMVGWLNKRLVEEAPPIIQNASGTAIKTIRPYRWDERPANRKAPRPPGPAPVRPICPDVPIPPIWHDDPPMGAT